MIPDPHQKDTDMDILKMMGFRKELSRQQLVAYVASELKAGVAMVHADPPSELVSDTIKYNVELSSRRHGPEAIKLRSDLISGRAYDLYDAVQGGTFPVNSVLAAPSATRSDEGFSVEGEFQVSPKRALEPSFEF